MPDFYRDSKGKVRIIRSSPGYDDALVGLSASEKDYLRDGAPGYTIASPGREERIELHRESKGKLKTTWPMRSREAQERRFQLKYKSRIY